MPSQTLSIPSSVMRGLLLCSLCAAVTACGGNKGPVSVPPTAVPPVTFAASANASDAVKNECALDQKLPAYLAEYAHGATPSAAGDSGRVLKMEYVEVHGTAGGIYSGAKALVVSGELSEGGTVLGTFRAKRSTGGGAYGGYKGTCSLLHRAAKATARDISQWLAEPTADARLGELK